MKRFGVLLVAGAASVGLAAVAVPSALAATGGCQVDYRVTSQWPGGFQALIAVADGSDPASEWSLAFDFVDPGQKVSQGWYGTWSQSGTHVTMTAPASADVVSTNGTIALGFLGIWADQNPPPVNFLFNGAPCVKVSPTVAPSASTPNGGESSTGTPVSGTTETGTPVSGTTETGTPVSGTTETGTPVSGTTSTGTPVAGTTSKGTPVTGVAPADAAPVGDAASGPVADIAVTGVVKAGVEMGCMLLTPDPTGMVVDTRQYLLLGGDRKVIVPGAHLLVTGTLDPTAISFCMQGTALRVATAVPVP